MAINTNLYDSATVEMFLLEEVTLQGRKGDLRQLLKWLNLARNGQTKTVLITGDPGIGKSALLDSFVDLALKGQLCRFLDLRSLVLETPEKLFISILEQLIHESDRMLDEAMFRIQQTTRELNLQWTRDDLLEAISLVRLSEFSEGKNLLAVQEQLIRKIKSSLPTVKKLKPSVQTEIEELVNLIIDPWLNVAASMLVPNNPQIQKALQYAETLKQEILLEENPLARALNELLEDDEPQTDLDPEVEEVLSAAEKKAEASKPVLAKGQRLIGDMTRHLMKVFQYINKTIRNLDSALLVLFDDWDQIIHLPEAQREGVKNLLVSLFKETAEQKNYRMMMCLCARSEGESYTLGGPLYSMFQNKLLLPGVQDVARAKLFDEPMTQAGITLDPDVTERVYALTCGNPFWIIKMRQYLKTWAQTTQTPRISMEQFRELGVETLHDLLEFNYCRIKLVFMYEDALFQKIISVLTRFAGSRPFTVGGAIDALKLYPGMTDALVFEALRSLYLHDFLVELPGRTATGDPLYQFQSRLIVDFLKEKTQLVQEEVSPDEKVSYLKKIIPLSLKSGELDRSKTQELIAINKAIGTDEMTQFLESTFWSHLADPDPAVRISAINNISALPSERTIERLLACFDDRDPEVRESAVRNIAVLIEQQGFGHGIGSLQLRNVLCDALTSRIDDPSERVRTEIYAALGKLSWNPELFPLLAKGLGDASPLVRIKAIQALLEMESIPFAAKDCFIQALSDPAIDVRKAACTGLTRFLEGEPDEAIIQILSNQLKQESDTTVRVAVVNTLGHCRTGSVLNLLANVLKNDASEDVRIAVARALGKWRSLSVEPIEEVLLDVLRQPDYQPPAVLWSCVRSLGALGETYDSIETLNKLKAQVTNDILLMAIEVSLRKIGSRLQKFQQRLDHQIKDFQRKSDFREPVTLSLTPDPETALATEVDGVLGEPGVDDVPVTQAPFTGEVIVDEAVLNYPR